MNNFILQNGATLPYNEFGDPSSTNVILYGHGFPGTGAEAGIAHRAALEHKVRIIAPTRPGIGDSTTNLDRTILEWPDMVNQLLAALDINAVSLLGISGGTPYALAYLSLFPERVKKCLIVSGMGPPHSIILDNSMSIFSRVPIWCAYNLPWTARILISTITQISKYSPETLLFCYRLCMSPDDKRLLNESANARNMLNNFRLALCQGTSGVYHDFHLLTSNWGFDLNQLSRPVTFWHGDRDNLVPISTAQANARQISGAVLKEYKGRGHFMAFEITQEIVKYFVE